MKSHEALKLACNRHSMDIAKGLHLSVSTIHKWTEPSTDFSDSGSFNPLDRLEAMMLLARSLEIDESHVVAPLRWLASAVGYQVAPLGAPSFCVADISRMLNRTVAEFGLLCHLAGDALAHGRISLEERRGIEAKGIELAAVLGQFLSAVGTGEEVPR